MLAGHPIESEKEGDKNWKHKTMQEEEK